MSLDDISSLNDDDDQVLRMRAWKCSMNLIFPGWLSTCFNCLKSKVALQMWRTRYESKSLCTSEGLPGPGWNPKDGDAWRSNDLQLLDMKFTYIYMNLRKSYDVKGDTLIDPSFQYKMKVCSFCRRKNLSANGMSSLPLRFFLDVLGGELCLHLHLMMCKAWWTAKQRLRAYELRQLIRLVDKIQALLVVGHRNHWLHQSNPWDIHMLAGVSSHPKGLEDLWKNGFSAQAACCTCGGGKVDHITGGKSGRVSGAMWV